MCDPTDMRMIAPLPISASRRRRPGPPIGLPADHILDSIDFLIETVDQIVQVIQMWRERFGLSYIAIIREYMEALAPTVARLAGQ